MIITVNSWHRELCRNCSFSSWPAPNGNLIWCESVLGIWLAVSDCFTFLQVIESINKCDVDIRRELFNSILVKLIYFCLLSLLLYTHTNSSYVELNLVYHRHFCCKKEKDTGAFFIWRIFRVIFEIGLRARGVVLLKL